MMRSFSKRAFLFSFARIPGLAALLAAGCASTRHLADAGRLYREGRYQEAAQAVREEMPADGAGQDRPGHVLDSLYLGSAEFMAGSPAAAEAAFANAGKGMDEQDSRPLGGLGGEYQGKPYDAIMANAYRALSLWMNGEKDRARVAFRKTEEAQERASDKNARLIGRMQRREQEEMDGAADKERVAQNVRGAMRNGANARMLELFRRDAAEWGSYDSFENPACHFLDAVFALANSEGPGDLEHGSFASRKALAMTPAEPTRKLFDLIEALADGRISRDGLDDVLVVIFENGTGPALVEKRLDLLVPAEGGYYYVGMALPRLVRGREAYAGLVLGDGDKTLGSTLEICDFDKIVTTSYRQALPGIIAAEVLRCSILAALQAAASEAAREEYGDSTALFVSVAGSLLAQAATRADTRSWELLPDSYQASVSGKPSSGVLALSVPGGGAPVARVAIPGKGLAVVYVKIPAAGLPPLCKVLEP